MYVRDIYRKGKTFLDLYGKQLSEQTGEPTKRTGGRIPEIWLYGWAKVGFFPWSVKLAPIYLTNLSEQTARLHNFGIG